MLARYWRFPPVDLYAPGQDVFNGKVAVDSAGNAIAVWEQSTGTNFIIQASRFSISSSSWSAVTNLSDTGGNAFNPQVAMDSDGNAIAVWEQSTGTNNGFIQASRFSISSGSWSAVADVANLSDTGGYALDPQVAMDSAGNAIAVWYQRTGTNTIIQASRFSGSSWSAVTDLSAPGQDALDPQVAMDSDGNAIAVWSRYDGTNIIIQAIQYK
jgi:predicted NBD/HSP70 family sugar kinase